MKSTKELLHQIDDPNTSNDERALLRCRLAKQLEEVGNYETAREAMGELWSGIGTDPNVEGLDEQTKAEVVTAGRHAFRLDWQHKASRKRAGNRKESY